MAKRPKAQPEPALPFDEPPLVWQRASYAFHSYAYRDPRTSFASGAGSPVVSPTTVQLGLISTLLAFGRTDEARKLIEVLPKCEVLVDAPDGIAFFRAFHQLRRYETRKYGPNARFGLTKINQGTREYGLVDGVTTLYVGAPEEHVQPASFALENLRHLGTHDSLCSLQGHVERCGKPEDVIYLPSSDFARAIQSGQRSIVSFNVTMVTLSRFRSAFAWQEGSANWLLSGGNETELISYVIPGQVRGTTRGKIYLKR